MNSPRRLRVVYLDHCAQLSGAEIALARLLPALLQQVDPLVLLGEDGPLVGRLQKLGIPVEVVPLNPRLRDLRKDTVATTSFDVVSAARVIPYVVTLTRRLRRDRPDLVHTNSLKASLYGGVAARLAGVPMVWHLHDRISDDYLPGPAVHAVRLATRLLPTVLLANSQSTLLTVRGRRALVVDNIVEPEAPANRRRAVADEKALVFGVVGRLAPWKGQHVFLEAFAKAFSGGRTRARLIGAPLFGEQAYEHDLRQQVVELGIDSQVEFRGFRERVFEEIAELDVLVHCSTTPEPFGQVVVEGMLSGLPVIAAAEGGPGEIVRHGVDGLLVPSRRPDLLAAAMRRLAENPQLRTVLGSAARSTAGRYKSSTVAEQVIAAYAAAHQASPRS